MLSPSDEAFLADVDVPSLRQTAEEFATPRCEMMEAARRSFAEGSCNFLGTRRAIEEESAKVNDLASIVRLFKALEADPKGTLMALGKALLADESSGRPRAAVIPLRSPDLARPTSTDSATVPGKARA